jgi:hypothetical protein
MRILREYECVAHIEHWCDICCNYIHPGEMYRSSVEVHETPKHRLIVWKRHVNPFCDYPPNPDWNKDREDKDLDDKFEWLKAA